MAETKIIKLQPGESVTIVCEEVQPTPQPTPTPEPQPEPKPQDLGKYQYSVGLLSDLHISKDSNEWWDEDDFKRCMDLFVKDTNVKCVMGCGDVAESATNAYQRHPEAVCDVDYKELKEMYDVPYWQVAGLRLFSPLGNHDFYGLFESRAGDVITGKENTECISGYNDSVIHRIADLWPTGQGINGIVPGRGRIVFDLEKGKSTPVGQADMNFFSFNDYVDIYCRQGGYTGKSVWDSAKGGISDEAIKKAESLYKAAEPMSGCNVILETIFPELAESEDERIREALINGFNKFDKSAVWYNGITNGQILAWLEKQGEQKPYGQKQECVDCQFNYAGECKGSCAMKRGEKKPTFKNGQCIVWKDKCYKVNYNGCGYDTSTYEYEDSEHRLKLYGIPSVHKLQHALRLCGITREIIL